MVIECIPSRAYRTSLVKIWGGLLVLIVLFSDGFPFDNVELLSLSLPPPPHPAIREKISEKLNSISVGVENDKYARVENVD